MGTMPFKPIVPVDAHPLRKVAELYAQHTADTGQVFPAGCAMRDAGTGTLCRALTLRPPCVVPFPSLPRFPMPTCGPHIEPLDCFCAGSRVCGLILVIAMNTNR